MILLGPMQAFAVKTVGDLKKVEGQVQSLVSKTLPCTVCIRASRGQGSGSGVIVSEDGLVLTAAHVTQAAGKNLVVIFPDGREVKAKSLGANRSRDAGMVQITDPGTYPFVEIGKSAELKRNDWCISLGHAGGFQADRTPPVRLGRVLNNGGFVVTDCTIIAGDSGGPLFDLEGRLIGIHSNIGESLSQNQHVPIDVFVDDWDRMKKGESWGAGLGGGVDPRQLVMGVQLSPEPNDDGVVLGAISPNSPAERAGLKAGDVITKINGKRTQSARTIIETIRQKKPGDKVKLDVKRGEESLQFEVRLIRAGQLYERSRRRQRQRPPQEDSEQNGEPNTEQKKKEKDAEDDKSDATENAKPEQPDDKKLADGESDDSENGRGGEEASRLGRSVDELMRDARRNGGRLKLTPEERQRLQKFMEQRLRGAAGRIGLRPPSGPDNWFAQVMEAYEPVVAIANDSTYRVLVDGTQVALATAVSQNTLLTKASEIGEEDFRIEIQDDKQVEGEIVKHFKEHDLVLIQVEGNGLKPVEFSSDVQTLPLGTFLASVGTSDQPEAIGLVSVKTREFESRKGFLGVLLDKVSAGIIIRDVVRRSPANRAGLRVNDVILELDDKAYDELPRLISAVGSYAPNEEVSLLVKRGEEKLTITAKLGVRQSNPRSRLEQMNQMGSELSETRSGFPMAMQHDCPISPNACGGPLVNLDGEVLGINIARAGRIKSYALPAGVIQELLQQADAKQQLSR